MTHPRTPDPASGNPSTFVHHAEYTASYLQNKLKE